MKKYIVILAVCLWHISFVCAETATQKPLDINIVGHVLDKNTREHLPYITISLKGTTVGTMTDASGHYFLKNLPEGDFVLEASSVGYETGRHKVSLKKGVTLEIDFEIEASDVALDGVVVSANRSETTRQLAPTLVNVLNIKTFENTNSGTLAQGLNFQPGVRVENDCQNCGFQQVRINGLDGPYTQILMDSRPIFSSLSGVYGLEQIPANMIERVEVMRGGGSALFGSSAIAGTINIITREPLRNSGSIAHSITSVGGSANLENNTSLNASLVTDDNKAGLYVFGQNRQRAGYDHDGDGFTELPELKSQTLGFRSYLKTSNYSKLTLEYHHIGEYRRGGNLLNRPPHEADIAEQVNHSINGGGLNYNLFTPNEKHRINLYVSAQHIDRDSYYGTQQNLDAYGETSDLTVVAGGQYIYSFDRCLFMPADLTAGIEYNYDKLHDEMKGYHRSTRQKVHIESAFLQNEWKNDRWSFLVGGRLDKHNLIGHVIFSPRANVRFNPTPNVNLRASYSSGFRAPQTYDEDLHVAAVGGEGTIIQQAANLKEEKSHSFSLSADMYRRFGAFQCNLLLEGFYTRLNNVFVLEEIGFDKTHNATVKERRNGQGAEVAGVTLEGKVAYLSLVQLQAGVTWQQSHYTRAERWSDDESVPAERRIFRTPDWYGYFTATYTPVKPLTIALSGTYTGSMLVQHMKGYIAKDVAETTPDFFDMTAKVSYDIPLYKAITLQLHAGVQNIFNAYQRDFDQGKDRDSGYIYGPSMPRSYFAGMKLSF
ncbi:TonB-dependent receptor [Barnesiella sp. An55]|uniref:TonB-dependent receptor n=1 Tax=Barnesiella sp. An55 TaxID=1965646 RepID=UPI000B36EFBB|nr:TonB-dependent receptor [Barnesiella sp. An55]OUN69015.1 TonB-dependent receptor [Barnesiella sp. An55]HIZ26822.1 TonB-dependent receptor [Candidatus Barnesiella merdipullorum]